MKTRIAIAACAAFMLIAGACSQSASELSDAELREALTDVLTEDDTFTDGQAGCVVDYLFANTTRDEMNRMADAQTEAELSDGDVDLLTDAVFSCLT